MLTAYPHCIDESFFQGGSAGFEMADLNPLVNSDLEQYCGGFFCRQQYHVFLPVAILDLTTNLFQAGKEPFTLSLEFQLKQIELVLTEAGHFFLADDFTVFEYNDPFTGMLDIGKEMGGDDQIHALLSGDILYQIQHFLAA